MPRLLALVIALAAVACGNSTYRPLPDGGCTNQHPACVTSPDAGPFSGCATGSACFPAKGTGCDRASSCPGFCVDMNGAPVHGGYQAQCEACGPCVFGTGGIAGSQGPPGCRETSSPSGCCDQMGTCELD